MNAADARLNATLAEYSALKSEITARSGFQHQIIQLHVTVLTALTGAVFSTQFGKWAALAIPIEAALFGLWYFDHALTITELSGYIQFWTEGRIAAEANAREVLKWESGYGQTPNALAALRIWLFRMLIAVTFFGPAAVGLIWLLRSRRAPQQQDNAFVDASFEIVVIWVAVALLLLLATSFACLLLIQHAHSKRKEQRATPTAA